MKLSVVASGHAMTLIPNIAKYANSQNKVSDADFFSNHPYHIRMEEISRRSGPPLPKAKSMERIGFMSAPVANMSMNKRV